MNRQASDTEVATRFLLNGRLEGPEGNARLVKVKGGIRRIADMTTDENENIEFEKVFTFKHPDHPFAQSETFFAIYSSNLYWWDGITWHRVEIGSLQIPSLINPRVFTEKGEIHILGGTDGMSALYKFIERDPGIGEGYFDNSDGFVGYWFGTERLPTAERMDIIRHVISTPVSSDALYGLSPKVPHYMMFVPVDINGQPAIPDRNSYKKIQLDVSASDYLKSFNALIMLEVDTSQFDSRIAGFDVYAAVGELDYTAKIESKAKKGRFLDLANKTGEQEFENINWRFLRRIDLNGPSVYYDLEADATKVNEFTYYTTEKSTSWFDQNILNGKFFVRYRVDPDEEWQYVMVETCSYATDTYLMTITVAEDVFVVGNKYVMQIVARWDVYEKGSKTRATGYIRFLADNWLAVLGEDKKVTINGQDFTEDVSWYLVGYSVAQVRPQKSLIKLKDAIIKRSYYVDILGAGTVQETIGGVQYFTIYVQAKKIYEGSAANSWTITTTIDPSVCSVSATLSGGSDVAGTGNGKVSIPVLWRFDGVEDADITELGDPIDTVQPYSTIGEYFPEARFACVQNRRTFRLACNTNKVYENMVLWSEPDMPAVIPNGNVVMLNTLPGEVARGIGSGNNTVICLMEASLHVIQMTGEPVSYDRDEGVFKTTCICDNGVVWADGVPFWIGDNGINMFDGGKITDLTENVLKDEILAIVADEYDKAGGSYNGITGFYNKRDKLILWSFPNSTKTVEGIIINLVGFDIEHGGFFFVEVTSNGTSRVLFNDFFSGYDGTPYGVSTGSYAGSGTTAGAYAGIYELFSSESVEPNRISWRSGILNSGSSGEIMITRLSLAYKGTPTVEVFKDRATMPSYNRSLPQTTTLTKKIDQAMVSGDELQLMIGTGTIDEDAEFTAFEIDESEIPSL